MTTYRITTKKKALKGTTTDDIFFGSTFKDVFDGRSGDDYIYAAEGSGNLTGGDGNDNIYGGNGSDKAVGGLGHDRLYGGRDNDRLYGDEDNDFLSGDDGNDRVDGGKGDDELSGGAGNDYLSGGAGDDILYGDEPFNPDPSIPPLPSRDRLLGGDGNDGVIVDGGDYALGGKGSDTLNINIYGATSTNAAYSINFSKITGKKAADIGHLGIKAGQFEKVSANFYAMNVGSVITGTKGHDTLHASGKSGVVNGGRGNDSLSASQYDADNAANGMVLIGGVGDDKLSGLGNVTLVGGAGKDQFILAPYARNTIADFSGQDDYFLVRSSSFSYYDPVQNEYVDATFDPNNFLVMGTDPKPTSTLAQFFYDTDDGKLYYDGDGTGLNSDLELVTTLANKAALKAADFVFVI